MNRQSWNALRTMLLVLVCAGCGGGGTSRNQDAVLFSAASSTMDAIEEIRDRFAARSGHVVELNFGSSATLATQIINGGDSDLFLSANEQWADGVSTNQRGRSRVAERVDLLGNRLVVVVPRDSPAVLRSVPDLTNEEFEEIAIANPDASVPAGIYAKEVLTKLGLWEELLPRLVFGENVRSTLRYVETRSVQAGIVYATDAMSSDAVRIAAEIAPGLHKAVTYPLLLLRHGSRKPVAREMFAYLKSDEAREIFKRHGFVMRALAPETAVTGDAAHDSSISGSPPPDSPQVEAPR